MEPDKTNILDPLTETALGSLKDIVVPGPISWMPQTWGWAVLAVIASLAILAVLVHRIWLYRANAYRREAVVLLDGIEDRLRSPATRGTAVLELAELLKCVSLAGWPRPEVASLSGAAWVCFLDEHAGGEAGNALDALLDDVEYQRGGIATAAAAISLVSETRNWIRRHHVSA